MVDGARSHFIIVSLFPSVSDLSSLRSLATQVVLGMSSILWSGPSVKSDIDWLLP